VDSTTTPALPTVDTILNRYLEASGGKVAFDKLTSRVSTGTVEITALGITGTAELNEEASGKSSMQISAPGLGMIQSTFDGSRAWLQDPLQGFIRFSGPGLEVAKTAAVFNKQTKLKALYPAAVLVGKEKLSGKDTYVVRMGFERWYFDLESGLLVRKGNSYFEDYREVDGIKLPFKLRDDVFNGTGIIFQFADIKHNVKIDESKFTAYPSCFTKP
jgi:zinc protease